MSSADPNAQLYRNRRGPTAKLCFLGHVLMKDRSSLVVGARMSQIDGASLKATPATLEKHTDRRDKITVGGRPFD